MKIERARTWVQSVAVGFLCVSATVTFAVAGGHLARRSQPQPERQPQASSGYVPRGMHEAEAGADIGPGSDEAQLVTSSWGE